jgi:hypothetical protein
MSKINLKGYKGFKILKSDHSLEANRLHAFCYMNDIPLLKLEPNNIFTKIVRKNINKGLIWFRLKHGGPTCMP